MVREDSIFFGQKTNDEKMRFVVEYDALVRRVLSSRKNLTDKDHALLDIGYMVHRLRYAIRFPGFDNIEAARKLVAQLNESGLHSKMLCVEKAEEMDILTLIRLITNQLIGKKFSEKIERTAGGRVIAYSAFGKASQQIKAALLCSDIRPDVYWDIQAYPGDSINGIPVAQPDFDSLCSHDTVLLLLKDKSIIATVTQQIGSALSQTDTKPIGAVQNHLELYHLGIW